MIAGGLTAVYAALHAMTATDLKRLLAFSTSENMGLVTLGVGAALMLSRGAQSGRFHRDRRGLVARRRARRVQDARVPVRRGGLSVDRAA